MGAVMPIAVALALFANVNVGFGRMPPSAGSSGVTCILTLKSAGKQPRFISWRLLDPRPVLEHPARLVLLVQELQPTFHQTGNLGLTFLSLNLGRCVAGQGAVMAWVLGAVKGALEWATVPVLALAMALPHGALVYWLSSSTCSLAQVISPGRPFAWKMHVCVHVHRSNSKCVTAQDDAASLALILILMRQRRNACCIVCCAECVVEAARGAECAWPGAAAGAAGGGWQLTKAEGDRQQSRRPQQHV